MAIPGITAMKSVLRAVPLCAAMSLATGAAVNDLPAQPPPPPAKPVVETLYGTKVTDPYRYFEAMDARTLDWIKSQGAYARAVFDAIGPRAALYKRMSDFIASFPSVNGYARAGGREFFEERIADDFDLMVKDARGTRKLVDIAALRAAHGGEAYAIDYFLASPDGAKVAVGISKGGSEAAQLSVFDTATGAAIAGPVDRADLGLLAWNDAGTVLTFNRLKALTAGESAQDKYKGSTVQAWDLKSAPATLALPTMPSAEIPQLVMAPMAPDAVAMFTNGAEPELALWRAPKNQIGAAKWSPFVAHGDGVTAFALLGNRIYLLSHRGAPTFKVLALEPGEPLSRAVTVLPARRDRIVQSIHAAADGLYVVEGDGVYSHLLRIAKGAARAEEIALPFRGDIAEAFSDAGTPGIAIAAESWTVPQGEYAYDPARKRFTTLRLGATPAFDPGRFQVGDLEAVARDGVKIPLTLVTPKKSRGSRIALLWVYGSYGISQTPHFSAAMTLFTQMGGAYAECHARGGGELGEAWRLAGKDANKPNTWRDLIACGEDLIARGITTRDKLFIWGGSAGGIAVGMAMSERPDLFAGVIDTVPAANMTRSEFTPDGPVEIPEFGTVKTEHGFRNLLAMDSYQHVRAGVHYPPILIGMGLNDARIAPWVPAKYAARLLAVGAPVLLRVDLDAGHGVTLTRTQGVSLFADAISFMFWHAGLPDWRPQATDNRATRR
jgi:prolyl oligopeptidase